MSAPATVTDLRLRDPLVPGVAAIGDAEMLSRVVAEAGEEIVDRGYLRYKPGTSLVAALRLRSGPAFAYAVSAAARPKLAKLVDRAAEGSVLCWSLTDGLLVARPAADRDLPALGDTAGLTRLCGVPAGADAAVGPGVGRDWTTLAYKPQRRWVGRRDGAGQGPVLRAYRRRALPEVLTGWRLAEDVADRTLVRLPQLVARSDRLGVLAVDWLPGRPLDQLVDGHGSRHLLESVGAALAGVHSALRRDDPRRGVQGTADSLRAAEGVVGELASVLPGCRRRAAAVLQTLRSLAPRGGSARPVHGDFSADQVIIGSDGSVGIADWDRAGWGDPAVDLGSLRASGISGDAYDAVVGGYRSVRALPRNASWHAALAGMLRLTEPLRRCEQDWRTAIAGRLTDLEDDCAALPGGRRECA